jgi:6-phosphofructokinase 2
MKPIITLTVNPAIYVSCVADEVVPMCKVRTREARLDPGGGLNVARELGGEVAVRVPIPGLTRVGHTVYESNTGQEFRFTPEGHEAELQHCLDVLSVVERDYFVVSGSLAPGMPVDFYARVGRLVRNGGGRVILNTSVQL